MTLSATQKVFLTRHLGVLPLSEMPPPIPDPDRSRWDKEVESARQTLSALSTKIRSQSDADCDAVAQYVENVCNRLAAALASPKAIDKMEKYLSSKAIDIVEAKNQFGIDVNLRRPLLAELSKMKAMY